MKNIFAFSIAVILFSSCHNTKAMSAAQPDQYARTEQAADPFLHELQQNNELVLAFAVETYAWAKTVSYKAIAFNNDEWRGYNWYVNKSQAVEVMPNINPLTVNNDSCNAVWDFFKTKEVWKIKGDTGDGFCTGDKANNCTINDGAYWRLLILTKDKITDPAYYEPEFFEQCCPGNTDRALFTEAQHKLQSVMGIGR
ncbi:MAG TPA: hypothetical protein PLA68_03315 [Panacibacter sp.]|nr:hypothetical protein [Panacibacter sp.]